MAYRRGSFALTPPSVPLFAVAVILAVLAALSRYAGVDIPWVSGHEVDTLAIAFAVLTAGVLARGI